MQCVHMTSSLYVYSEASKFSSYKEFNTTESCLPTLMTSFNFNYFLNSPISNIAILGVKNFNIGF